MPFHRERYFRVETHGTEMKIERLRVTLDRTRTVFVEVGHGRLLRRHAELFGRFLHVLNNPERFNISISLHFAEQFERDVRLWYILNTLEQNSNVHEL